MEEGVEVKQDSSGATDDENTKTNIQHETRGIHEGKTGSKPLADEGINASSEIDKDAASQQYVNATAAEVQIRTLDGEIAGDEFAGEAINYQILLGKIDGLLDKLRLDA